MRLNRRRVGDTIQYLTESGEVIADLNGYEAHAIWSLGIVYRTDLTVYDTDLKRVVYGTVDELFEPHGE